MARLAAATALGKRPRRGEVLVAKPYREVNVREATFATDVGTMWRWFGDREAHVNHDERISSITVMSGEWGLAGCVSRVAFVTQSGQAASVDVTTIDVLPGVSFTSLVILPSVATTTVHSTTEVTGGVTYRQETRLVTRPVGFLARRRLARERLLREERTVVDHAADMAVIQAYIDSQDRREP